MRFFNRLALLTFYFLISINSSVAAEEQQPKLLPFSLKGIYVLTYAGIPIGQLDVKGSESADTYNLTADAKLVGIAKLFVSHESQNKVEGKFESTGQNYVHAARMFNTHYTSSDGWRNIKLTFAAGGKFLKEEIETTNEMKIRPKVPDEMKDGMADTLTMVPLLRQKIYQAHLQKQKQLSERFYDGKRLSNVRIQVYGIVNREWRGIKTPVVKVGMLREPLEGYTAKELRKAKEKPMGELLVYFTANDQFIPILGEVSTVIGKFHAELK